MIGPESAEQKLAVDYRIAAAASSLIGSRLSARQLQGLAPDVVPRDEAEAYRVQRAAHRILSACGFGVRTGWKVGCTTKVMQAYLGIDNPCAGGMFQARMWRHKHTFAIEAPRRLGVECEIAVRIGHDLPGGRGPYDLEDVAGAVAACIAAIEVVEDRYVDYSALDTPTLIADDFFHHSNVLGAEVEELDPRLLSDVSASMSINGQQVGTGQGRDILGEPLEVLRWLANNALAWGEPLHAGEVILLGSLVQTQWVAPGDVVSVSNDTLGPLGATFTAA
jgi:2-keto-4-pentenoate hydratase